MNNLEVCLDKTHKEDSGNDNTAKIASKMHSEKENFWKLEGLNQTRIKTMNFEE